MYAQALMYVCTVCMYVCIRSELCSQLQGVSPSRGGMVADGALKLFHHLTVSTFITFAYIHMHSLL